MVVLSALRNSDDPMPFGHDITKTVGRPIRNCHFTEKPLWTFDAVIGHRSARKVQFLERCFTVSAPFAGVVFQHDSLIVHDCDVIEYDNIFSFNIITHNNVCKKISVSRFKLPWIDVFVDLVTKLNPFSQFSLRLTSLQKV